MYDPGIGRWLSEDPIGFEACDANLYRYVGNDPTNRTDPSGMWDWPGAIVGALFPPIPIAITAGRLLEGNREQQDRSGHPGADEQGRFLLNHWLDGSGTELRLNDESWQNYMRANQLLPSQAREALRPDILERAARGADIGDFAIRFHGNIENGYGTGYQLLHGSKAVPDRGEWLGEDQGDVQMVGTATRECRRDGKTGFIYTIRTTWNDIIDPNPRYVLDTILSVALHAVYHPRDYKIKITWESTAHVVVDNGIVTGTGWPYDSNR
jgi:hypothetical protein